MEKYIKFKYLLWHQFSPYKIHLILSFQVGVSSAYFHATLSLLGQMLDELAILWLLCASYSFLTPNRYRPSFYRDGWAHIISFIVAVTLTAAWFVAPQINAYALFIVAVPIIIMQVKEIVVYKNPITLTMTRLSLVLTVVGFAAWISDKLFCNFWLSIGIPGLHNIWHLLIAIASYLDITLFGYLRSAADFPSSKPSIKYWPGKTIGLPYVHCRGPSR